MKAISLHQPWATLIALGVKTIETRSWSTKHRGSIAIHAGAHRPPMMWLPPIDRSLPNDAYHEQFGPMWHVIDTITDPKYHGPQPQGRRIPKTAQTPTLFWPGKGPHAQRNPDKPEFTKTMHLPLGAIVATANLAACVPMLRAGNYALEEIQTTGCLVFEGDSAAYYEPGIEVGAMATDVSAQLPYGHYAHGRWAWMLEDITPIDPVPARGRQGLWNWSGH